MKSFWKQIRYRLEYFGCVALAGLIPRLPRRVCVALSHVLGDLFYRLDRRSRAVALENLRLTLGATHDAARRETVARASFRNFARAMLDLFWARNLTPENFQKYIQIENFGAIREAHARHGGVIFLALHAGSHEWVSLTSGLVGTPSSMVALAFKNPALDVVFRRAREHSGNTIIGQKLSMLRLLRAVKRGGVGLLADLALRLDQPGELIDAFGMTMHVTFLHALLHTRTGVPIIPVTNVPHPDGTCTVTAHAPMIFPRETDLQTITQACWDFFEPFIRARPELWLWNYKHWRYRPRAAPPAKYPFYAHWSDRFEEILKQKAHGPPAGAPAPATHD